MLPSLSLSSSPNSATVKVDKATSEFLMAPDWTLNMEICDSVNSDHWMAKEVIKAVKKRLQHKNPRVQMLTLTVLETLVKNCGDNIHFHIAERKVLDEMIKIVKKRTDLQVRSKILVLLDSWQEAFGGPGGRHSQYYWAFDELRRSGIQFPQRSSATAPIITPPATQLSTRNPQVGPGISSNSLRRQDEAMPSDVEVLNASGMEAVRNAMELLSDMLQAINPNDRMSVKDEVIIDLVDRCRTNQRKLMEMLATTMNEEVLGQGLELNDALQALLAKHDAIASGSPLPAQLTGTASSCTKESPTSHLKPSGSRPGDSSSTTNAKPSTLSDDRMKGRVVEEEEDDEFALIARRHLRSSPVPTRSENVASSSSSNGGTAVSPSAALESTLSNALVPVDPPAPVKTTKDQDMVDLLSIVLSTSFPSEAEPSPPTPKQAPAQSYTGDPMQPTYSSYVVPWAQTQFQQQSQFHSSAQSQQEQGQFLPQQSKSVQASYPQQLSPSLSAYPPPPWAPTPGYPSGRTTMTAQYTKSMPQLEEAQNASTHRQMQSYQSYPYQNQQPWNTGYQSLQHSSSFKNSGATQPTMNLSSSPTATAIGGRSLEQHMNSSSMAARGGGGGNGSTAGNGSARGQKPYVPSYRLFEELNVLGNIQGKIRSGAYPSASNNSGQGVLGGTGSGRG